MAMVESPITVAAEKIVVEGDLPESKTVIVVVIKNKSILANSLHNILYIDLVEGRYLPSEVC